MTRLGMAAIGVIRAGIRRAALVLGTGFIVLGALGVPAATGFWQRPSALDFRNPERQYERVKLADTKYGDVTVSVEKQLKADAPAVSKRALARLKAMRAKALAAVPKPARAVGEGAVFCLVRAEGEKRRQGQRAEYFQKNAPEHHPELDRRWGDAIVIYCAQNYLAISDLCGAQGAVP